MISLIAAIGKNRELGKNNELLWSIPEDMKHFRDTTRDHVVIMGQRTFESIGRPLPERENIVLSADPLFERNDVEVVRTPEEALETAKAWEKNGEVFIIGGAMIYSLFLPKVERLYLTCIDKEFPEADVFFPEYESLFTKVVSERQRSDEHLSYRFMILER